MTDDRIETIHHFWFGDIDDDGRVADRQAGLWWRKSPDTDALIRSRFGALVEAAAARELAAWERTARGRLALILLLDQFPRNMFRGSPEAFAHDGQALHLSLTGQANGHERELRPIERVFLYLPMEHAEDAALQARSVAAFRTLRDGAPLAQRPAFDNFLDFALRHQAVIERFGRFPHRNAILGRENSAAEADFLKQPGSGF